MSELSQIYLVACIGYALCVLGYIAISLLIIKLRKKEVVKVKLTECNSPVNSLDNGC